MRRVGRPFECPVCGEDVPAGAKSCPECGACEKSGWSGDLSASELDLPKEDFDYEKFVADEFSGGPRKGAAQWVWWVTALVLLLLTLWALLPK
jgi:hypothetical protein